MPTPRQPHTPVKARGLWLSLTLLGVAGPVVAQAPPDSPAPTTNAAVDPQPRPLPPDLRWPGVGRDRLNAVALADLWGNPVVLRELHLPPERQQAIDAELTPSVQDLIRLRTQVRNVANWRAHGQAAQEALEQARANLAAAEASRDQVIRSHLTEEEYRRLAQIRLQRRGIRGLALPEVADAIHLSATQRNDFRAVLAEREARRLQVVEHARTGSPEFNDAHHREVTQRTVAAGKVAPGDEAYYRRYWQYHAALGRDLEACEDAIDAGLYGLLTPVQRKHFEWLLGRLVDIDQPAFNRAELPQDRP